MTNEKTPAKRLVPLGLIILSIVFLTNPVVNVFDYLPDFVAYIIIIKALKHFAERVPYFEEARAGFKKLFIVSLVKLPSYFIMIHARGQNTMDYDINSLLTFSFTAIEVVLLFGALKSLFKALCYFGERGGPVSLISPFAISKNSKRICTTETLELLSYIFIFYKAAATPLPEMLLLTRGVSAVNVGKVFNVARLYPYVIIFAVVSVFVFGIIVCKRFCAYVRAVRADGEAYAAADEMLDGEGKERLARELKIKDMGATLSIFVVAAFLMVDLCFDNLLEINLLPQFLFGAACLWGLKRLTRWIGESTAAIATAAIYTVVAAVKFVLEARFLTEYGYEALAMAASAAGEAYLPVAVAATVEFSALCVMLVLIGKSLTKFSVKHTGIDVHSERYSRLDKEFHSEIKKKIIIHTGFGILVGFSKLLEALFRLFPTVTYVSTDVGSGEVVSGLVPWFPLVMLLCTSIYVGYTIHVLGTLKEESKLKYC